MMLGRIFGKKPLYKSKIHVPPTHRHEAILEALVRIEKDGGFVIFAFGEGYLHYLQFLKLDGGGLYGEASVRGLSAKQQNLLRQRGWEPAEYHWAQDFDHADITLVDEIIATFTDVYGLADHQELLVEVNPG